MADTSRESIEEIRESQEGEPDPDCFEDKANLLAALDKREELLAKIYCGHLSLDEIAIILSGGKYEVK